MMYYNENTIVYHDGAFVKASEARGNLFDQTLHYGYGVFEGIRSYNTHNGVKIFKAKEHYDRMAYSCQAIKMPYSWTSEELIRISYQLLEKNNLKDAYLRPLVTSDPNMSLTKGRHSRLFIAAWDWGAYLGEQLLRLRTSSFRRLSSSSFKVDAKVSGHYINSILATQEAKDQGYDEALLLDMNGFIAEGPGANFFIEKDGILHTPALGSILPGITRATVIDLARATGIEVIERQITPEEVYEADSAFYCGTAAEVIGILSLDNYCFPKAWAESIGARLQSAYKDLVLEKAPVESLQNA